MKQTWTQTLMMQLVSLVILLACAAAFGLGRPESSAPGQKNDADQSPITLAVVAVGQMCGLDVEPAAPMTPARRAFGASRCTE